MGGGAPELAGALGTAASALWSAARVEEARDAAEAGITLAGGPDEPAADVPAQEAATIAMILGQTDEAVTRYRRLAAARRRRGEPVLALLAELAAVHALVNGTRATEAAEVIEDLLDQATHAGNPTVRAWAHYLAGEVTATHAPARATGEYQTAISSGQPVDSRLFVALARSSAAALAARTGDTEQALDTFPEVLEEWIKLGNTGLAGWTLQQIVVLLSALHRDHDAAVLAGALNGNKVIRPAFAVETDRVHNAVNTATTRLGADAAHSAWNHGHRLSPTDTVEHARRALTSARTDRSTPSGCDQREP